MESGYRDLSFDMTLLSKGTQSSALHVLLITFLPIMNSNILQACSKKKQCLDNFPGAKECLDYLIWAFELSVTMILEQVLFQIKYILLQLQLFNTMLLTYSGSFPENFPSYFCMFEKFWIPKFCVGGGSHLVVLGIYWFRALGPWMSGFNEAWASYMQIIGSNHWPLSVQLLNSKCTFLWWLLLCEGTVQ